MRWTLLVIVCLVAVTVRCQTTKDDYDYEADDKEQLLEADDSSEYDGDDEEREEVTSLQWNRRLDPLPFDPEAYMGSVRNQGTFPFFPRDLFWSFFPKHKSPKA